MRHGLRRRRSPPPTPVDQGYAWVILAASSLVHMLVIGNLRTFSIVYTESLELFQNSASNSAWMYGLYSGLILGSGPLAKYLGKSYTFKTTVLMGGIVLTVGYVSAAFVKNIGTMCLTAGAVAGLGGGLCYTPSFNIIDHYFKKKRELAHFLVLACGGIGNLILPYIYFILTDKYGLNGCMMVMGGVLFNVCVAGALFRQPIAKRPIKHRSHERHIKPISAYRKASIFSSQPLLGDLESGTCTKPTLREDQATNVFDDMSERNLRKKVLLVNLYKQEYHKEKEKPVSLIDRPRTALRRMSSCPSLAASMAYSTTNLNFLKKPKLSKIEEELEEVTVSWKIKQKFTFGVCAFAITVMYIGYSVAYLSIGAHARDLNLTKLHLSIVISLTGLGEIISALVCGSFVMKEIMHLRYILSLCIGINGIACCLMYFVHEMIGMCCFAVILGLLGGSIVALYPRILLDALGRWELSNAMLFISLFMASGTFFCSPVAGLLRDFTGSWIVSFYFVGGMMIFGAVVLVTVEPVVRKCRDRWGERRESVSF